MFAVTAICADVDALDGPLSLSLSIYLSLYMYSMSTHYTLHTTHYTLHSSHYTLHPEDQLSSGPPSAIKREPDSEKDDG